ncbi:hypothetical protein HBA91_17960, partial [Ochrobactrum sp. MR34]|nr:hypothetical protein [Ochrobactrum sp. MR34]
LNRTVLAYGAREKRVEKATIGRRGVGVGRHFVLREAGRGKEKKGKRRREDKKGKRGKRSLVAKW